MFDIVGRRRVQDTNTGENFVTDQVETDRRGRAGVVKVKGSHGFSHILA
jgi:hypothetical protein